MTVNRCVVLAAGFFAAAICDSALGADFYLKSGATDWSAASSYCTDADRTVEATALPGTYLNCEGLENIASWKIKVDGEKIGKCRIKVVDGKIRLDPYGLTVTLR